MRRGPAKILLVATFAICSGLVVVWLVVKSGGEDFIYASRAAQHIASHVFSGLHGGNVTLDSLADMDSTEEVASLVYSLEKAFATVNRPYPVHGNIPIDPWGSPYHLEVIQNTVIKDSIVIRLRSNGPNRKDEDGHGDDLCIDKRIEVFSLPTPVGTDNGQ